MTRLLILGGTGEAAALAETVHQRFGAAVEIVTSLAGRTRHPRPLPGAVRTGGFGGAAGLVRYLRTARIDLLIDATHPYAARISANAHLACAQTDVPRLALLRPPWTPEPGDIWIAVADCAEAARRLPELGRRALVTLGTGAAAAFAGLAGVHLLLRVAEAPGRPPPPGGEWIVGRGPFREAEERRLLEDRRIDVVVSRNSGGTATVGKIVAARSLAIPVMMVERPPPPPGGRSNAIEETIRWIAERLV